MSYGRLRGIADTTIVFGWLAVAGFAAIYALIPRITEVQLHNEVLGAATTLTWSVVVTGGVLALVFGINQGRPLGELPAGADLGMALLFAFVLFNAGVTVVRRARTHAVCVRLVPARRGLARTRRLRDRQSSCFRRRHRRDRERLLLERHRDGGCCRSRSVSRTT